MPKSSRWLSPLYSKDYCLTWSSDEMAIGQAHHTLLFSFTENSAKKYKCKKMNSKRIILSYFILKVSINMCDQKWSESHCYPLVLGLVGLLLVGSLPNIQINFYQFWKVFALGARALDQSKRNHD